MGLLAGRAPVVVADRLYAVKGSLAAAVARTFGNGMSPVAGSNTGALALELAGGLDVSGTLLELQPTARIREIYSRYRMMEGYMALPLCM
jgi:hypothetical protein